MKIKNIYSREGERGEIMKDHLIEYLKGPAFMVLVILSFWGLGSQYWREVFLVLAFVSLVVPPLVVLGAAVLANMGQNLIYEDTENLLKILKESEDFKEFSEALTFLLVKLLCVLIGLATLIGIISAFMHKSQIYQFFLAKCQMVIYCAPLFGIFFIIIVVAAIFWPLRRDPNFL